MKNSLFLLAIIAMISIVAAGCATAPKTPMTPETIKKITMGGTDFSSPYPCVNLIVNKSTGIYRVKCRSKDSWENFIKFNSEQEAISFMDKALSSPEIKVDEEQAIRICNDLYNK
ncbi:MAG: hypothetical protein WC848_00075 [Parcubacteria group bacterium]|jgi:hypothetical protein